MKHNKTSPDNTLEEQKTLIQCVFFLSPYRYNDDTWDGQASPDRSDRDARGLTT